MYIWLVIIISLVYLDKSDILLHIFESEIYGTFDLKTIIDTFKYSNQYYRQIGQFPFDVFRW